MSDQTDSGFDARKGGSQPPNSQDQNDSKESNSLAGEALAKALMSDPEALEIVRRDFQRNKDRGVAQANKNASEALKLVQGVATILGIEPDKVEKAQREMILQQLIDEKLGFSGNQSGGIEETEAPKPASSKASFDLETIQKVFPDLDYNDPKVLSILAEHGSDKGSLYVALGDLKASGQAGPKSSGAMVPTPGSGQTTVNHDKKAALRQSYQEELATMRQANRGAVTPIQLATLKKKYRDLGLDNLW